MCKECDEDHIEGEPDLEAIIEQQNEADQEYAARNGIEPPFEGLPGQRLCGWARKVPNGCDRVALEGSYCLKHEKAMRQEP
jgi:hypothetical protein